MQVKQFIKSICLSWKDLLILPFIICGLLFLNESTRLSFLFSEIVPSWPLYAYIIFAVISYASLFAFLFFKYRDNYRPSIIPLCVLIVTLVFTIISIFSNPEVVITTLVDINGNTITTMLEFSGEVKFIHFSSFFFFIVIVYIGMFVLSKNFRSHHLLSVATYVFYLFTLFAFIYSLIKDDYVSFFSMLFGSAEDFELIKPYIPRSTFGNPNMYALYLEFVIFMSLLNYSFTKCKYNYIATIVCFFLLVLTLCKSGIAITSLLLVVYIVVQFIIATKKNDKKDAIFYLMPIVLIGIVIITLLITYFINTNLQNKINYMISLAGTFSGRVEIWKICLRLFSDKVFYGYGHGIYNSLLNYCAGFSSSHNSFLAMMGEGGIVYLIIYLILIGYSVYLLVKIFKKQYEIGIPLIFGITLIVLHSVIEDSYYYVAIMAIYICITNSFICKTHQE